MELVEMHRVGDSFRRFHNYFRPVFGRKQYRERSKDYMRGLLVQASERRNAENISEVTKASPRVLQRFLTEAHWDDWAVVARLQGYLGERLDDPDGVFAVDDSGFPKAGKKSVGVARQYCNSVGKVAGCQVGVFLGYISSRGRALVDKRLYLPVEWTDDPSRMRDAGVPEGIGYRAKTQLALDMLRRARELGLLSARWVVGDDAYGMSPEFRDLVAAEGFDYVLEVPSNTPVWPVDTSFWVGVWSGFGRPPVPSPVDGQRMTVRERAEALPVSAWQETEVAEGSQGPRKYLFAYERIRETRDGRPGTELWLVYRKNLDGSEPRYYFSNAGEDVDLEKLAKVGASRWPIETEFQDQKSYVGMDQYEVRSWQGWHHHMAMCLLAGAFLLTLEQEWGKKDAPDNTASGLSSGARTVAEKALKAG